MTLWSGAPPEARSSRENYPTLLFSWWCTGFAATIILFRLVGRKIRNGLLFPEDRIMALSLVPLLARMGIVHVILLYGTNNVVTTGLTASQIERRSIGSRLVLASRISYAMFIWTNKVSVSEFLKRTTQNIWRRSYEITLRGIRVFLLVTFLVVVITTLTECRPFHHYWQVVPDPGPQCRQGFGQLISMGAADMVTDILLVVFPIPIILRSHMRLKRKISLVLLFSLSIVMIVITGMRVVEVIAHLGRQQYRTVWASCEILASAAVSNAIVLGSFIRDRGVKRVKYRRRSMTDSIERAPTRRSTITRRDSDEDLFRAIGCRIPPELRSDDSPLATPARAATRADILPSAKKILGQSPAMSELHHGEWNLPPPYSCAREPVEEQDGVVTSASNAPARNEMYFNDVGGLLGNEEQTTPGAPRSRSSVSTTITHDFATTPSRSGSRTLLSDLGGLLSSPESRPDEPGGRGPAHTRTFVKQGREEQRRPTENIAMGTSPWMAPVTRQSGLMDLQDAGGLLR